MLTYMYSFDLSHIAPSINQYFNTGCDTSKEGSDILPPFAETKTNIETLNADDWSIVNAASINEEKKEIMLIWIIVMNCWTKTKIKNKCKFIYNFTSHQF